MKITDKEKYIMKKLIEIMSEDINKLYWIIQRTNEIKEIQMIDTWDRIEEHIHEYSKELKEKGIIYDNEKGWIIND